MCDTMQLTTVLIVISSQVAFIVARTGFAKDENEDLVEFPPIILRSFDSSIPVGHLRPLGQSAEMFAFSLHTPSFIRFILIGLSVFFVFNQ